MTPIDHARLSVDRWGGSPHDYLPIHEWLDQTKAHMPDFRHRMLLHNSFGMLLAEQVFGAEIQLKDGARIAVREITRMHITEDLGYVPTVKAWFDCVEFTKEGHKKMNQVSKTHLKRLQRLKIQEFMQTKHHETANGNPED